MLPLQYPPDSHPLSNFISVETTIKLEEKIDNSPMDAQPQQSTLLSVPQHRLRKSDPFPGSKRQIPILPPDHTESAKE